MNDTEAPKVKKGSEEASLVLTQHELEEFLKTLISRDVDLYEEFDVVRSIN
ncbi:hypothetical protein [Legionella taurinensis]|uniref:hypothetical protein n=1 Tax=Legionella taurinensis TaxID=70611 RepID=UPI000E01CC6D|nr:hypothetical protein [Legionella taurinensis]MDX1836350.1 hypothetical protein [Legionella taurinensis]STY27363.1 Uncharacterised protein [Legionella taurinensis]